MPYCNVLLVRSNPKILQNTRLPKSLADEVGCVMPLGIASIAAYLRDKGVSVSIIDAEAENGMRRNHAPCPFPQLRSFPYGIVFRRKQVHYAVKAMRGKQREQYYYQRDSQQRLLLVQEKIDDHAYEKPQPCGA